MNSREDRIKDILKECDVKTLKGILNSNKEYIIFDIAVFNVGHCVKIIKSNNWNRYKNIGNDGYSFLISNDLDFQYTVETIMKEILNEL